MARKIDWTESALDRQNCDGDKFPACFTQRNPNAASETSEFGGDCDSHPCVGTVRARRSAGHLSLEDKET
jgi:hypothetical protein